MCDCRIRSQIFYARVGRCKDTFIGDGCVCSGVSLEHAQGQVQKAVYVECVNLGMRIKVWWDKPLLGMLASHNIVLVQFPAKQLQIQLPTNSPDMVANDGTSTWFLSTYVRNLGRVPGSHLQDCPSPDSGTIRGVSQWLGEIDSFMLALSASLSLSLTYFSKKTLEDIYAVCSMYIILQLNFLEKSLLRYS